MTVDWSSIYLIIALLAAMLSMVLMLLAWSRRQLPGAMALVFFAAAIMFWATTYALEIVIDDFDTMIAIGKVSYLGIVSVMPLWLVFAIYRTGNDDWITARRAVLLLFLPSILVVISVFTSDYHQLFWTRVGIINLDGGDRILEVAYGAVFWIFVAYTYVLFFIASGLLLRMALYSVRLYRSQAIQLLIGVTIPVAANMLFLTGTLPGDGVDITPLAISGAALIISRVLLREYLPDSLPVARQTIIENMDDGMIVVDNKGLVVEANPTAAQLLGGSRSSMIGSRFATLLLKLQHPHVLQVYEDLIAQSNHQRRDEAILGRDKVRTFIEISVSDLYSRSGRPLGYAVVLRDINDRKRSQMLSAQRMASLTALHNIDERISSTLNMEVVLESALDAAIRMSGADAGLVSLIEDKELLIIHAIGYGQHNRVGQRFPLYTGIVGRVVRHRQPELIYDVNRDADYITHLPETRAQMSVPLITRDNLIGVLNLETATPQKFNSDNFSFIKLLAGRIATAVENARLYTMSQSQLHALEALYEQVSSLEQLKTDMIRIASHDLRNPLGTVLGYLDLMEMDSEYLIPEHQDYVGTLKRLVGRMEMIITDILALERLQQDASYDIVDLQALVRRVLVDYAEQVREKMLRLKTHLPAEPVYVWGDSAQLREAIGNLVSNAIKYTPETGRIDVKLGTKKGRVILEVTDTGYGIPDELQANLFQPFFRAISDKTRTIDGVGLGLNLVKNIIERHQGEIRFKSVYGKGSTFGFALPEPEAAQVLIQ